jgi:hypothetical protein
VRGRERRRAILFRMRAGWCPVLDRGGVIRLLVRRIVNLGPVEDKV